MSQKSNPAPAIQIPSELLNQLVGQVKTEQDLSNLIGQLTKHVIESSLKAELNEHLDVEKQIGQANSRNGSMGKTLKGSFGEIPIHTPRDRNGTFEPIIVRKGQTRFTAFDDQIIALYGVATEFGI